MFGGGRTVSYTHLDVYKRQVQLQVRVVEEPYLLATHGKTYAAYAARVGRFVPGAGRLHTSNPVVR